MNFFTALADPTRANIISMLSQNERLSVAAITSHFEMSAPAVSQHLKVLRIAKLVNVEVSAQQRFYSLNLTGIKEVENWFKEIRNSWEDLNNRLFDFLENQGDENE
ncbi:MAG: regulatory protein ArsR [Hyphomonadaceae bacterium]|nr:MAG: regulatory protein ArsR [Hyphomonadaceae bacterium]KAF0186749.1 MAG: regulatory protein ArsR [Hyphomonadaceae bacterium]